MFDCHVHTTFSADSSINASCACETAIESGLDGIAFTDHLDFDYPGETILIDFERYFSEISFVQAEYEKRLKVLKAIEVGIQPHVLEESLGIVSSYDFDYVLASVHIIGGIDPYRNREYYTIMDKIEAYGRYLQEILFMVRNFKSFDMVGHFDYIIRYASYVDRTLRYDDHCEILDQIMKELIRQGRGFELNTGTYRKSPADAEYDINILKRYRQLGGELICLGSDAHRLGNIAARFGYYAGMIRDAGFKYMVHFEGRKPVFDKL
ncbi:MAG: histidinol-phosphatase HisJ family protein [Bacillota bacterium]